MSLEQISTIMQDMMITTLLVSAPSLLTGLAVGLVIAVFQAATQINEQTLTFVPKIVAVFGVFGALFPWMMQMMMEFSVRVLDVVASQGGTVTVEVGLLPLVQAILGSVRVLLMMIVGPLFSHPAISLRIRLGLALTIAWAIGPVASGMGIGAEQGGLSVGALALAVLSEVVIGLAIGLGAGLVFAGILQLGEFMAVQGGLGAARSIDPATGVSTLAISTALNTFAMLVFLVIGGHHELIRGLALSFEVYPIGGGAPDGAVLLEVARLGSVVWEVAFRLAAPLTVAIFVQNVATGVLGRAMPQLNLLLVNLPMHVGMLFLLIGLGANDYLDAFARMLGAWPSRVFDVLLGGVHGG